jgi:tRNA pseudouridine55 synthase
VNLVINLNKDRGFTSQDAVTAVKKLLKVRKAGHAGTLDPLAAGVLLVCLNEATKITGFLSDLDKEYLVTAKLGESTDTYDAEGKITGRTEDVRVSRTDIAAALDRFTGEIEQVPPMYSAIKKNGTPLYELARKGIEVERETRRVTISSIGVEGYEAPYLTFRVTCSKGTYVRSLCHDLGEMLGTGAHMTGLVRTRIGGFLVANAARLDEIPRKAAALHTLDAALRHVPVIALDADSAKRVRHGNPVRYDPGQIRTEVKTGGATQTGRGGCVQLRDPEGKLLGIGRINRETIRIERLLNL